MSADVARSAADVVVVACDSPDRDMLENIREINAEQPRPIVMFVERSDPTLAEEAIKAGVSAYIVEGLSANRVRPILEVAISRFRIFHDLQEELEKAKSDLNARKVIEQAKGILMKHNGLTESDAYNNLRRSAMTEGKTILEIADAVISVARLLKT
jgi:response regulator NasT